jgi:pimeloyl-ACP methyl ester carboxylesterase
MRKVKIPVIVIAALIVAYLAGPRLEKTALSNVLPSISLDEKNVAHYVDSIEASRKLKPDNHARILWNNDSLKNKTEYAVVYLPGYGASWFEGEPTHRDFARAIGANLYLSRLWSHGIDTPDPLIDMYPAALYESAKEALMIARALGNKVIVMSTSTGGTLALKLAADFPEEVHSLILLSPNVAINNPAAPLLSKPWGLQIARLSGGGGLYRELTSRNETESQYWDKRQRWESTVYLQQLIDATMTQQVFSVVKQPVFLGYYYKNEEVQDPVVKVSAMLRMFDQLGTPDSLKVKVAFPNAGDHVIGSSFTSESYTEVEKAIGEFARKTGIISSL